MACTSVRNEGNAAVYWAESGRPSGLPVARVRERAPQPAVLLRQSYGAPPLDGDPAAQTTPDATDIRLAVADRPTQFAQLGALTFGSTLARVTRFLGRPVSAPSDRQPGGQPESY